jgi:TonB family protein
MKLDASWPRWIAPPWLVGLPISLALHLVVVVTAMAFLRAEQMPTGLVVDLSAADREVAPARGGTPAGSATPRVAADGARSEERESARPSAPGNARPASPRVAAEPPRTPAAAREAPAPPPRPRTSPLPDSRTVAPPPPPEVAAPHPEHAPVLARDEPASGPVAHASPGRFTVPSATAAPSAPGRAGGAGGEGGDPRAGGGDHVGSASGAGGSGTGSGGGGAGGDRVAAIGPGGGDGLSADYGPYKARLRQRIQDTLRYPPAARRRGVSGTVQLEIAVQPDGSIGAVTVVASSSHDVLDRAAVDAVRGLPRMPFPADVRPSAFTVRLPVVFELQ